MLTCKKGHLKRAASWRFRVTKTLKTAKQHIHWSSKTRSEKAGLLCEGSWQLNAWNRPNHSSSAGCDTMRCKLVGLYRIPRLESIQNNIDHPKQYGSDPFSSCNLLDLLEVGHEQKGSQGRIYLMFCLYTVTEPCHWPHPNHLPPISLRLVSCPCSVAGRWLQSRVAWPWRWELGLKSNRNNSTHLLLVASCY